MQSSSKLASPITIETILSKTTDLPTIPVAAIETLKETENPNSTAASISQCIVQDQALTTRVLRLANSAYYGLSRRVTGIPDAVSVLGTRTVRNLCMVAATYPWLSKPVKGYELGPKELWKHSFGVAVGARLVAEASGKSVADVAFTAGLLHDMGKTAMSVWFEGKMHAMQIMAEQEGVSFDVVERRTLGFDHCEVGAALAEAWNLPPVFVRATRYHHSPSSMDFSDDVVDCVHLGDYLTMTMGLGLGGDGLRYNFDETCLERLSILPADIELLAFDFIDAFEAQSQLFEGME